MKTLKYTILLVLLVGLTSCEKTHIDETENPNVKTFIKLLKSSQYDSLTLPEFTYKETTLKIMKPKDFFHERYVKKN